MAQNDEKERGVVSEYQKWDYITLSDFRTHSCWHILSYGWLWFLAGLSIYVYGADTFTAANLLIYDKWSGEIQPPIPFSVSKWIFAGCILFSWVLCGYEWIRAIQVMRRGNVAESYLDPLSVTLQSIGCTGQGFRRFLVFAELTKSKKGGDKVALFVYFQFKGAIRILLAEGPRQAINAITLYSVGKANFLDKNTSGLEGFVKFWANVEALGERNRNQAIIMFTMLSTLIIWAFSMICFIAACLLHVGFLWHYIPKQDGSLSRYCRRKVDRRLDRIVRVKVEKAMAKREAAERKNEEASLRSGGSSLKPPSRAATFQSMLGGDSDISTVTSPTTTVSSFKSFPSQPLARNGSIASSTLSRQPTLPDVADGGERPPMPARSFTQSSAISASSIASDRPLMPNAASMGVSSPDEGCLEPKLPVLSRQDSNLSIQRDRALGPRPGVNQPRKPIPMQTIHAGGTPNPSPYQRSVADSQWSRPNTAGPPQGTPARNFSNSNPRPTQPYPETSAQRTRPEQELHMNNGAPPLRPSASPNPGLPPPQSAYRPYSPLANSNAPQRSPPERSATYANTEAIPMASIQRSNPPRRVGTAPVQQNSAWSNPNGGAHDFGGSFGGQIQRHRTAGLGYGHERY